MVNKFRNLIIASTALSLLIIGGLPLAVSAANIQDSACQGSKLAFPEGNDTIGDAEKECNFPGEDPSKSVNDTIADIVNIFSVIVGIVAVIMIIYGGFRYITSGGDSGKITDARNTIIYAIVGLVIVAFAQFVVKFVLSKVTQNTAG